MPIRCIHAMASLDIPAADLAKRFGLFNRAGAGYLRKTSKNILYGAQIQFMFGNIMREDSLLINVKQPDGYMITQAGQAGYIGLFQRGYDVSFGIGKLFPNKKAQPNKGIYYYGNYGFNQNKIKIFDRDDRFTFFQKDYAKGYDRLGNGLFTSQEVGYMFFNGEKPVNFNVGFRVNYAANRGRREWLFDVQRSGLDKRTDLSFSIVGGWIIAVYKRKVEDKYY
jgi:hypothetical protein